MNKIIKERIGLIFLSFGILGTGISTKIINLNESLRIGLIILTSTIMCIGIWMVSISFVEE